MLVVTGQARFINRNLQSVWSTRMYEGCRRGQGRVHARGVAHLCRLVPDNFKARKTYGRYTEDMPSLVEAEIRESLREFLRTYLFLRAKSDRPVH